MPQWRADTAGSDAAAAVQRLMCLVGGLAVGAVGLYATALAIAVLRSGRPRWLLARCYALRDGKPGGPARAAARRWSAGGLAAFLLAVLLGTAGRSGMWRLDGSRRLVRAAEPLTVRLLASDYRWNAIYAGADKRFATPDDFVVVGRMHLPAGRPVRILLASSDRAYSLHLPAWRLAATVMPGRVRQLDLQAAQPGRYEAACARPCGWGHELARLVLVVTSPNQFDRWLAAAERLMTHPRG